MHYDGMDVQRNEKGDVYPPYKTADRPTAVSRDSKHAIASYAISVNLFIDQLVWSTCLSGLVKPRYKSGNTQNSSIIHTGSSKHHIFHIPEIEKYSV